MKWNEFYKALDAGTVAPVYLFTGPEEYVKREALEALRARLLPPGLETLNDVTLEGVTAQQITDAAETMPMMCPRRIVTVRDWAPLLQAKSKNEDGEVAWIELLSDSELARWAAGRLKPLGKKIDGKALSTLTYMAGRELTRLSGELDKLAAYLGDERGEITEADVAAIVSPSLEYNVFELLNSLLAGDVKTGQQTVNSLLQGGQTTMGLMAMLTRQIRQLAHMKCALDAGKTVQAVQEQLKLHPYAAKQTARQCARLSADRLTGLYEGCVASDYAVKSGRLRDRDALDALIFQIGMGKY